MGKLRMLGFDLQLSPGEGSFVTNKGDGVGIFGDGPVDAHEDAEEPEENVKLGVGLSTKSVSGGYVKDCPPETLLSPEVQDCERPRFKLFATRLGGKKSRSQMVSKEISNLNNL